MFKKTFSAIIILILVLANTGTVHAQAGGVNFLKRAGTKVTFVNNTWEFGSAVDRISAIYATTGNFTNLAIGGVVSGDLDLDGYCLIMDADGNSSLCADTNDQIDIAINAADDFRITENTFTALGGSVLKSDIISETTADNGVVVDGVSLRDGGASFTAHTAWSNSAAVTAASYSVGRDADATNQLHFNVPTGAGFEFSANDSAVLKLGGAQSAGSPVSMLFTGGAHTTLTASTEAIDVDFDLNRNVQFSTGALALQRAMLIEGPTYTFVGASTISDAITLDVENPTAGANATLTRSYSMRTADVFLNGGQRIKTTDANAATYTILATDYYIQARRTATGALSLALPSIATVGSGKIYVIKDSGYNSVANNITVQRDGTDKIDNVDSNYTIAQDGTSITLISNATTGNWEIN